jgi:NADH dehydrogenase FAD-containing subunit
MSEVLEVNVEKQLAYTDTAGCFTYDYLVVDTGCTTNFLAKRTLKSMPSR